MNCFCIERVSEFGWLAPGSPGAVRDAGWRLRETEPSVGDRFGRTWKDFRISMAIRPTAHTTRSVILAPTRSFRVGMPECESLDRSTTSVSCAHAVRAGTFAGAIQRSASAPSRSRCAACGADSPMRPIHRDCSMGSSIVSTEPGRTSAIGASVRNIRAALADDLDSPALRLEHPHILHVPRPACRSLAGDQVLA